MDIVSAIILGLIQGLTEFIPVSSSGHLVVVEHILNVQSDPIFDSLVNLGTFFALLVYFRKHIVDILKDIFVARDVRFARNVILSVIPVGFVGFYYADYIQSGVLQNHVLVACMLIAVGVIMAFSHKLPTASHVSTAEKLSAKRAFLIGLVQTTALIPGVSRSGATILAGRFAGLSFSKATEYSFLLFIPVMAGVVLKGLIGQDGQQYIMNNFSVWVVSNLAAFISGIFAVGFMLNFLKKSDLRLFGYYRIILGLLVLVAVVIW